MSELTGIRYTVVLQHWWHAYALRHLPWCHTPTQKQWENFSLTAAFMTAGNANDCTNKLKACENKLSSANQEFRDYKEKAGRILQAKEKVIASLKEGKAIVGDSSGITGAEYEAVCQERDVLRDELHQVKYGMEQLKVDVQVITCL